LKLCSSFSLVSIWWFVNKEKEKPACCKQITCWYVLFQSWI
jgi:hypothetical protein